MRDTAKKNHLSQQESSPLLLFPFSHFALTFPTYELLLFFLISSSFSSKIQELLTYQLTTASSWDLSAKEEVVVCEEEVRDLEVTLLQSGPPQHAPLFPLD
ncbi:unnamed protein product [Microthlaspi erraticum]|uniref:Uncharacterized protein n=1 Tax=Microthlaspi erraticum TaxID=1685480 RepID=A0A6D2K7B5_9BRAS|nr:unnamed protein product [Microthlaspi erraticum]